MYVFLKEDMKYPVVCTEDRKHRILVGCDADVVNAYSEISGLKQGKEGYFIVHKSDSDMLFSLACASLPRRLNPIMGDNEMPYENFYSMHKYFYRNNKREMIVHGVYFGTDGEECPFTEASTDPATGFTCLKDIKLHG